MHIRHRKYAYGTHPSEFLQVYMPNVVQIGAKLFLIIHGGFWKEIYDLEIMKSVCEFLASHGHIAVNLEYPRVGEDKTSTAESIIQSIYKGYDYCEKTYPAMEKIVVGHSAGGYFALLLAAQNRLVEVPGLTQPFVPPVKVIALAAVTDLWMGHMDKLSTNGDAVANFVGFNSKELQNKKRFVDLSPISHEPACEVHLVHGYKDEEVPLQYSRWYFSAWKKTGKVFIHKQDADHMDMIDPANEVWSDMLELVN